MDEVDARAHAALHSQKKTIQTIYFCLGSTRLTSRCPQQAWSGWSWHQIPTGKQHRLRQMVKESHHKVDPCPLCAPGQMICSRGEKKTPSHQQKTASLPAVTLTYTHARVPGSYQSSRKTPDKFPAEVTHMEGWYGKWCAVRPQPRPNFTHWARDPSEMCCCRCWVHSAVLTLIPLDLHSCL